jgi:hypothetical protein
VSAVPPAADKLRDDRADKRAIPAPSKMCWYLSPRPSVALWEAFQRFRVLVSLYQLARPRQGATPISCGLFHETSTSPGSLYSPEGPTALSPERTSLKIGRKRRIRTFIGLINSEVTYRLVELPAENWSRWKDLNLQGRWPLVSKTRPLPDYGPTPRLNFRTNHRPRGTLRRQKGHRRVSMTLTLRCVSYSNA